MASRDIISVTNFMKIRHLVQELKRRPHFYILNILCPNAETNILYRLVCHP